MLCKRKDKFEVEVAIIVLLSQCHFWIYHIFDINSIELLWFLTSLHSVFFSTNYQTNTKSVIYSTRPGLVDIAVSARPTRAQGLLQDEEDARGIAGDAHRVCPLPRARARDNR